MRTHIDHMFTCAMNTVSNEHLVFGPCFFGILVLTGHRGNRNCIDVGDAIRVAQPCGHRKTYVGALLGAGGVLCAVHKVCAGTYPRSGGKYLRELGMPPLTLHEEGLIKGATTPPTALWNAPHKAAPARNLGRHGRGHPAHVCCVGGCPHMCHVHVLFAMLRGGVKVAIRGLGWLGGWGWGETLGCGGVVPCV